MGSLWRWKDTIAMGIAIILLLLFALGIVIGISYATESFTSSDGETGPKVGFRIIELCAITTLIPGLIFLFIGITARKKKKQLVTIASLIKAHRRLSIDILANKIDKQAAEVEMMLLECLDKDLIQGFIDGSTNEFVIQESVDGHITAR